MDRIAVFMIRDGGFTGMEGETAERVSRHLLLHGEEGMLDLYRVREDLPVGELGRRAGGHGVFVLMYGDLFATREGVLNLARVVLDRSDLSVIVPVSNESRVTLQRHAPPFYYQTLSVFRRVVMGIHERFGDEVSESAEIDDFCFAFRREVLEGLPRDTTLGRLPEVIRNRGMRFGIARGVYVHRYGDCHESGREDLLSYVPRDARNVLDVGCARGLFGEMLKRRQECAVTGVELDGSLAAAARARLDRVVEGDIEGVIERGMLDDYDCIVCGDVLEHLYDPWKVVRGLRRHLRSGGVFIACTPNIANWAVVREVLQGRWDYVPFSILSGTHIRFFTELTFRELFEDAGYSIKELFLQTFALPPEGEEFVRLLRENLPEIREEELLASEIVVVAE